MNVISHEYAQVAYLASPDEIKPVSGLYLPDLIAKISARYLFAMPPTDLAEAIKNGAKFATGRYMHDGRLISIQKLDVYRDGVIIGTNNTEDSDLIMNDIVNWMRGEFNFRVPLTSRKRYVSQIVVDFEIEFEKHMGIAAAVAEMCAGEFKGVSEFDHVMQIGQFSVEIDPANMPQYVNTKFLFERRIGYTYNVSRYLCSAPLPTVSHMTLLQRIEDLMRD